MMPNTIDLYAGRLPDLGADFPAEDRPARKAAPGKVNRAIERLAAVTGRLLAVLL